MAKRVPREVSEYMSKIGKKGGKKGGKVAGKPKGLAALSPERRKEIASKGGAAKAKAKE